MSPKRLLVINPNTTKSFTNGIDQLVKDMQDEIPTTTDIITYTAPSGPSSINDEEDGLESAKIVLKDLTENKPDLLHSCDAILVACYSVHPLIGMLQEKLPYVHVTGIFEASISTALSLLPFTIGEFGQSNPRRTFGIVTTGTYWEKELSEGVQEYLALTELKASGRFKGVETTGLTAGDLHSQPAELVQQKLRDATKRLVKNKDVRVVCLGCAGMTGLESAIEQALIEELGQEQASQVIVLDGVRAGIAVLEGILRTVPSKKAIV